MAKLIDKFFNRVIEGELSDLSEKDGQEIGKVVSSGTKLYKHKINISNSVIRIISTISDKATTGENLDNIINNSITSVYALEGDSGSCFVDYENSLFMIVHYGTTSLLIDETIDYYNTAFTDEVTPL